ncbi:MAG: glycosyltransferase family 4 protein [Treponema sp.]|uniref:glycosyltransferase family 4 protein n=1 Tax=unclassified Treponema TaxID=2638727 RepID=UPI001B00C977|nr:MULTISPECIES: glycosyltransferase family 1 protein [unclassified Treponema]MBO6218332.1 glycosyltransferase family 4 protein [Treponema sp.]MBQ8680114.1 glycosyltransferase family 4 protein [Treponema sp.]MBR1535567.1 glycosyltransferase family 4 protein [Treponema sp.]MBR1535940.1 glycosyltransferase family 4 protein [Treponema sp.]
MKIGIDTFGCEHGRSGIGSYLSSLSQHFQNTETTQFELFGAEIDRYTYGRDSNISFESIILPDTIRAEKAWHMFLCNQFAKKQKYDALLFPASSYALPLMFSTPSVAVVNDIVSELFATKTFAERMRIKHSLKRVNKIIAPSNFIKKDLKRLGVNQEKITVVHNGINHSLFYQREFITSESEMIKPFAIRRPYFLYASKMSSSSKRHVELIKAFEIFKKKTGLPHRLVLAGSEGECADLVKKTALISPYASDIFITGYFPHESFPALYAGCEGCLFPSEIEGVGLPILEAMATGIPVACSKAGALQEIAGEKAILFDSTNIDEMAAAIEKIATDNTSRKKMIKEGIDWAKKFNWENTAQETLEVLKSVVK